MHRRTFLKAAGSAAALPLIIPHRVFAQSRPFTFTSWGGALSEVEKRKFLEPFSATNGLEIVHHAPTENAKIKAMVEAGNVEWDLVSVGGRMVFSGEDENLLVPLDFSKIPNAAQLDNGFVAPCGVATTSGATVISWSKDAMPDGGPQSWAEFWDVKRFPGARGLYKNLYYNYECAVLAAGLRRDEVYPFTEEKGNIALGKIKEIKPSVSVWWGSGAQPPQLLATGELALASAWSGRILAAAAEGAPIDFTYKDSIAWGAWWVIPKGSPYVEQAHQAINFAIALEQQKSLLNEQSYGPVIAAATADADEEMRKKLALSKQNISDMIYLDEREAAKYMAVFDERWQQLMLE